ncbi:SRPBCC family protein [Natronomonas salina]|uniref:SRPBCC family protein n=1 Tax=Natronomonas salina TaxID=1710540 RepID=UPI0015B71E1E|nr:SRPBCC family protein [Natronomonas salina]QLD90671.1 SRPBCC family protein [Natronomonas salina]
MTTASEDAAPKAEAEEAVEESAAEADLRGWERAASTALGGFMLVGGLRRRSLAGLASAGVGGALLYRGLGDWSPLQRGGRDAESEVYRSDPSAAERPGGVERSIIVGKPAEELSEYWQDAEHLSRLLGEFAEVSDAEGNRLRWEMTGPLGRKFSWETRTMLDRPGEELRWRSTGDAAVANEWTVRFEELADGEETKVTLTVALDPPGGAVGRAIAGRLLPEAAVGTILDRFKSLVETGEIPSLEKNPSARGTGDRI